MTDTEAPRFIRAPEVMALLNVRFPAPEWGLVEQVSANGGRRYADAVAMNLWTSRGLGIHGFEVKVSRSDWLRELRKPEKAEESVFRYCDHWWLVAPRGAVKDGELPPPWGLLEVVGDRLVQKVQAPKLTPDEARKPFLAAVWRRVTEWRAEHVPEADVEAEVQKRVPEAVELALRMRGERRKGDEDTARELVELRAKLRAFEETSGLRIDGWHEPKALGEAVRSFLTNRDSLSRNLRQAQDVVGRAVEAVAKLPGDERPA